jgi:hypothetical protein
MKCDRFINTLDECCNDVQFSYHGKSAGVMPGLEDGIKVFHVWYGDDIYFSK